jgi:hypothetical protein
LKKVVAIAFLLVTGSSSLFAQVNESDASSGSIYSKIGIGFPIDGGSSAADGMGIMGVSYMEAYVPGYANPAHWGHTVYGMATGGIGLHSYAASDNQSSATNVMFSPTYFQVQFPLLRNELGMAVVLAPVTRSTFNQVRIESRIIGSGSTQDTLVYQMQNQGSGGVNKLEMGVGWRVTRNLSIGYAASLVFASIDNEYSTIFANSEYNPVRYNRQTSGIGFGNRFGIQLGFPSVFGTNDAIDIGASVRLPITLNAERIEEADKTLANGSTETVITRTGDNLGDGEIRLPLSYQAGLTYQLSRPLAVAAEGLYQSWSDFNSDFNEAEEQLMADRYKLGLGLRYFPYINGSDNFLSRFKYRLGATYDTGHLEINGARVETLMFSFGLGILSPKSPSSIDISFEYGIRGTKAQDLVKENIWGLRLSLNLAELVFYRPKLQ